MIVDTKTGFRIRNAKLTDVDQLVLLEQEWPENARASLDTLAFRIKMFPQGQFIAEDETGIIASIICCPYVYEPDNLSHYGNWQAVIDKCYKLIHSPHTNALYIVSGTTKRSNYGSKLFAAGVNHVVQLAKTMGKQYVTAGCVLPGYAKFLTQQGKISAKEYVFKKSQTSYIDPLLEKYRRLQFYVPDTNHILANYFQDEASLNYAALVVRELS